MNEDLQKRISDLETWRQNMSDPRLIPYENDAAFRERFIKNTLATSIKSNTSESNTVNEAGASPPYQVLSQPDGFLEITIGTTIYYIPYFT